MRRSWQRNPVRAAHWLLGQQVSLRIEDRQRVLGKVERLHRIARGQFVESALAQLVAQHRNRRRIDARQHAVRTVVVVVPQQRI